MLPLNRVNFDSYLFDAEKQLNQQAPLSIDLFKEIVKFYDSEVKDKSEALSKRIQRLNEAILRVEPPSKPQFLEGKTHFISPDFNFPITNEMLMHICGGRLARASGFEGQTIKAMMTLLRDYLEEKRKTSSSLWGVKDEKIAELLRVLNESLAFQKSLPANIELQIGHLQALIEESVQTKKPILVPGGWVGAPSGHAIYYEIIPIDEATVRLRLFNLGAGTGIDEGQPVAVIEGKKKAPPFAEWEVPLAILVNPNNLRALLELRHFATYDDQGVSKYTLYSEEDIFKALKSTLEAKTSTDKKLTEISQWMSTQHSGVCAWRSLCAYLKTYLEDDEAYRGIKCDLKLAALNVFLKQAEEKSSIKRTDYILIDEIIRDIGFNLASYYEDGIINDSDLREAQLIIEKGLELLKKFPQPSLSPDVQMSRETAPSPKISWQPPLINNEGAEPKSLQETSDIYEQFSKLSLKDTSPKQYLEGVLNLTLQAFPSHSSTAINQILEEAVKTLPLEPDFWIQATNKDFEEAKELIALTGALGQAYFKNLFYLPNEQINQPQQRFMLLYLLSVQETLLAVNPHFKGTHLFNPKFTIFAGSTNPMQNLFLEDAALQEKAYELFSTERRAGLDSPLFPRILQQVTRSGRILSTKFSSRPLKSFLSLQAACPEVFIPQGLSLHESSYHFFSSPNLPAWALGIRDLHIYQSWLYYSKIKPHDTFSADAGQPEFILFSKSTEECSLEIRLTSCPFDKTIPTGKRDEIASLFNSPDFKELASVYQSLKASYEGREKRILTLAATELKNVKMPREEFIELVHLFTSTELQIQKTIAFFSQHPEKLENPDCQNLFQLLMFENSLLEEEKRQNPKLSEDLDKFFKKTFSYYSGRNQEQPYLFLMNMQRKLGDFSNVGQQSLLPGFSLKTHLKHLQPFLSEKKPTAIRSLAYAQYIACSRQLATITEENAAIIIKGLTFLQNYPIPPDLEDLKLEREVQQAKFQLNAPLSKFLETAPNEILNEVLQVSFPEFKEQKWHKTPEGKAIYQSAEGELTLLPLEGLAFMSGEMPLPKTLLANPLFSTLFPDQKKGTYLQNSIFSFIDRSGFETAVHLNNISGELTVNQKRGGEWHAYVPKSAFLHDSKMKDRPEKLCTLNNLNLTLNYTHWINLERAHEYLIVDPVSGQARYRLSETMTSNMIVDLETGGVLMTPIWFTNFEHPLYINYWTTEGATELPRFNLSFKNRGGDWSCDQFPGFKVSFDQQPACLNGYPSFILLENSEGEQKLLLPFQTFSSPLEKASLMPAYRREQMVDYDKAKPQSYFVYDLDNEGSLKGSSCASKLYLAETLFLMRNYDEAIKVLQETALKMSALSSDELKILREISILDQVNGDASPNARAVRAYASYLILQNSSSWRLSLKDKDRDNAAKNYAEYLKLAKRATCYRFNPLERALLEKVSLKTSQGEFEKSSSLQKVLQNIPPAIDGAPPWMPLLTRLPLSENLQYFYEEAQKGNDFVKKGLLFSLNSDENKTLAAFLLQVAQYPSMFPPYSSDDLEAWIEEVCKISAALPEFLEKGEDKASLPGSSEASEKEKEAAITYKPKLAIKDVTALWQEGMQKTIEADVKKEGLETTGLADFLHRGESPEWLRLREDLTYYEARAKAPVQYTLTDISELTKAIKLPKEKIERLEKKLVKKANKAPEEAKAKNVRRLEILSRAYQPITLSELLIFFSRQDGAELMKRNPALSKEEVRELFNDAGKYLIKTTMLQQQQRINVLLERLHAEAAALTEKEELEQLIGAEVYAKRHFVPSKNPEYLTFEHFVNKLIRENQIDILNEFIEKRELNLLSEMIMGAGKSSVLLVLYALFLADGEHLSSIVVPPALFESIAHNTQTSLKGLGAMVFSFHFDRHTPLTEFKLKTLIEQLQFAKDNKHCVIMTNKSLQCLILRYAEMYIKQGPEAEQTQDLKALFNLICDGNILIDEVDTVLNVFKEVMFSIGDQAPVESYEIKMTEIIYQLIYTDPDLKALARVESDPKPNLKAPFLNENNWPKYQQVLIPKFLEQLQTVEFDSEGLTNQMQAFAKEADPALMAQLWSKDKDKKAEAKEYLAKQPEGVRKFFKEAVEQMNFVSYSLMKTSDQNYGITPEEVLAIPFAAVNSPNIGSQFASYKMTFNYTFQSYVKKGIPLPTILQMIKLLQAQAIKEMKKKDRPLEETKVYKKFQQLIQDKHIPLFNLSKEDEKNLFDTVNATLENRLSFAANFILPQLKLFTHKLSCNPHQLIALLKRVSGFTGTLGWNIDSYNHRLHPNPAIGTDSKTLSILWSKDRHLPLLSLEEGHLDGIIDQLFEQEPDLALVTDAGGYFKMDNYQVAQALMRKYHKPVVFFSTEGSLKYLDLDETVSPFNEKLRDENAYLTFLDQSHTVGTDITYHSSALAVVTIGKDMILRDLLQAVWRLRQLDKNQKVRFALSAEVENLIKQRYKIEKIGFDDILSFVIENQEAQKDKEILKTLQEEFPSIAQALVIKASCHPEISIAQAKQLRSEIEELWVSSTKKESPESPVTLENAAEQAVVTLKILFSKYPWLEKDLGFSLKDSLEEVEKVSLKLDKCPLKEVELKEEDPDASLELEQMAKKEAESQAERQASSQEDEERWGNLTDWKINKRTVSFEEAKEDALHSCLPFFPFSAFLKEKCPQVTEAFNGIDMSYNLMLWKQEKPSDVELFGLARVPLQYVLEEEGKPLTLLSELDAELFKKTHPKQVKNIALDYTEESPLFEQLVKIKFLNGESDFSKKERAFLSSWFQEFNAHELQEFYLNEVLKGFPMKLQAYRSSPLRKVFKKSMA